MLFYVTKQTEMNAEIIDAETWMEVTGGMIKRSYNS
jgi:hypothetical protein